MGKKVVVKSSVKPKEHQQQKGHKQGKKTDFWMAVSQCNTV